MEGRAARRRLVCVGKHVHGRSALVSLELLPALCAASGEPGELAPLEQDVVDFLGDQGPCSTADLLGLIGHSASRSPAPSTGSSAGSS